MKKFIPLLLVICCGQMASAATSALVTWRQAMERATTAFAPYDIQYDLTLAANTAAAHDTATTSIRSIYRDGKSYLHTAGATPTKVFLDEHALCMQQNDRWGCQQIPAEQFADNLNRRAMNIYPITALRLLKQFVALNSDRLLVAHAGSDIVANRPCTAYRTVVDNARFDSAEAAETLYVNVPSDANVAGVAIDTCFDQLTGQLLRYTTNVVLDEPMAPGTLRSTLEATAFRTEPPADPAFYAVPQ